VASVDPSEYPQFPDSLTEASARSFVLAFDRAYHRNEFILRHNRQGNPELARVSVRNHGITDVETREGERNIVLGASGVLSAAWPPDGATTTDYRGELVEYDAPPLWTWYHLTPRRVAMFEHDGGSPSEQPPALGQFWNVYCR